VGWLIDRYMEAKGFNRQKFDNLVHYIIGTCPDTAKLGSVKLHKILWKSDTRNYLSRRESISGAKYVKREWGPTADALLGARERLQKAGKIRYWRDHGFAFGHPKDVYVSKLPPQDIARLDEKQVVDFWIQEICLKHTAESISDEKHGYAWEIARMGEKLPLASIFVDDLPEERDEEGREWAAAEAERLNLGEI
jgi:hypothetical protein